MSRVQNLLPSAPVSRSEANSTPTTGRDFDDVLTRTYQDRRPKAAPKPERRPEPEKPSNRDHQTRADQASRADNPRAKQPTGADKTRPDPSRTVAHRNRDDHSTQTETEAESTFDRELDDVHNGHAGADIGPKTDSQPNQARDAGPGTDIVAESVAGIIVDPVLLAAMVTAAPTVLTLSTAGEPAAGMPSVAAVDGGTAIIVTAPGTAPTAGAGTAISAETPVGNATVGGTTGATSAQTSSAPTDSTAVKGTSGAPGIPGPAATLGLPTTAAAASGTAAGTTPGADTSAGSGTSAVPAAPGLPVTPGPAPASDAARSDTALLAMALTPAAGTVPPASTAPGVAAAAIAGIDGTGSRASLDAAPSTGPVPSLPPTAANRADGVLSSTPAAAPAVDPVAAALAGAYGIEVPGSGATRPTGQSPSTPGPAAVIGGVSIGPGLPIALPTSGSKDTDPQGNSNPGSGAQFSAVASDVLAATPPSAAGVTSPASPGLPGTPGIPVPGVNGTAPIPTTTEIGSGERSTPTSEITEQVAAQINRQLHGSRMLSDGTHHTVLRLSPEHLGDVTITLDVRAGGLRLDLSAGAQALVALQADLGQLRDTLASSGLDLGEVTFNSQGAGPDTNGQAAARERWQDQAPAGGGGPGGRSASADTRADQSPHRAPGHAGDGGLDVLA